MYTDGNSKQITVAVKDFVLRIKMQKKVDKEAKTWHTLQDPNILYYYGGLKETSSLVTEYLHKMIDVDNEQITINNVRQLLDELEDDVPWKLRFHIAQEKVWHIFMTLIAFIAT